MIYKMKDLYLTLMLLAKVYLLISKIISKLNSDNENLKNNANFAVILSSILMSLFLFLLFFPNQVPVLISGRSKTIIFMLGVQGLITSIFDIISVIKK